MDLEIALEHSRKLIPGLELLAASLANPEKYIGNAKGLAEQDAFALKEAAENPACIIGSRCACPKYREVAIFVGFLRKRCS